MMILGFILAAGGGWGAWWAFNEAPAGEDFYNLVGLLAIFICVLGVLLIIFHIFQWWMSE
jgi:hypothetical protein